MAVLVAVSVLAVQLGSTAWASAAVECGLDGDFENGGGAVRGVCTQTGPGGGGESDGGGSDGTSREAWVEFYLCPAKYWQPGGYVTLSPETTTYDDDGRLVVNYVVLCWDPAGTIVYQWDYLTLPAVQRDLGAEARSTRDRLLAQLQVEVRAPDPAVATSPPVDGTHLVGTSTWFWVDPTSADTVTRTAQDPAGLTVTLTATATEVRFYPNDATATGIDTVITCTGTGTAWKPGMNDDQTDCRHFWDQPSSRNPDGTFTIHAETDWQYTWTATGNLAAHLPATTGTLGVITTNSAPTPITVVELQAVIDN